MKVNCTPMKKVMLIYVLFCLAIIALSCIGFIFNEWTPVCCTSICSLCGSLNAFFLIKGSKFIMNDDKKWVFVVLTIARFLMMLLGLVLSALTVYFTMGKEVNSLRYLIVAVGALPYFVTSLALSMNKGEFED